MAREKPGGGVDSTPPPAEIGLRRMDRTNIRSDIHGEWTSLRSVHTPCMNVRTNITSYGPRAWLMLISAY